MTRRPTPQQNPDPTHGTVLFKDGLGIRVADPDAGETGERLVLCPELAVQESALRDRLARLSNFRHVRFPRVRAVEVHGTGQGRIVSIVSERMEGVRLSDVLRAVDKGLLTLDVNAALQVGREILPALAVLHDSRNVTHGAIGPERLLLTAQGRITLVDHTLALALEKLQYPRSRLWREFRIAMPPSAGLPRFDSRADVAQVALTVFALILGYPLSLRDFPDGLKGLVERATERTPGGTTRPLSPGLRAWFDRALPMESRKPFTRALDAQVALEDVIKRERLYAPAPSNLKTLCERYAAALARQGTEPSAAEPNANTSPPLALVTSTPTSTRAVPPTGPIPHRPGLRVVHRPAEDDEAEEIRRLEVEIARLRRLEEGQAPAVPAPSRSRPSEPAGPPDAATPPPASSAPAGLEVQRATGDADPDTSEAPLEVVGLDGAASRTADLSPSLVPNDDEAEITIDLDGLTADTAAAIAGEAGPSVAAGDDVPLLEIGPMGALSLDQELARLSGDGLYGPESPEQNAHTAAGGVPPAADALLASDDTAGPAMADVPLAPVLANLVPAPDVAEVAGAACEAGLVVDEEEPAADAWQLRSPEPGTALRVVDDEELPAIGVADDALQRLDFETEPEPEIVGPTALQRVVGTLGERLHAHARRSSAAARRGPSVEDVKLVVSMLPSAVPADPERTVQLRRTRRQRSARTSSGAEAVGALPANASPVPSALAPRAGESAVGAATRVAPPLALAPPARLPRLVRTLPPRALPEPPPPAPVIEVVPAAEPSAEVEARSVHSGDQPEPGSTGASEAASLTFSGATLDDIAAVEEVVEASVETPGPIADASPARIEEPRSDAEVGAVPAREASESEPVVLVVPDLAELAAWQAATEPAVHTGVVPHEEERPLEAVVSVAPLDADVEPPARSFDRPKPARVVDLAPADAGAAPDAVPTPVGAHPPPAQGLDVELVVLAPAEAEFPQEASPAAPSAPLGEAAPSAQATIASTVAEEAVLPLDAVIESDAIAETVGTAAGEAEPPRSEEHPAPIEVSHDETSGPDAASRVTIAPPPPATIHEAAVADIVAPQHEPAESAPPVDVESTSAPGPELTMSAPESADTAAFALVEASLEAIERESTVLPLEGAGDEPLPRCSVGPAAPMHDPLPFEPEAEQRSPESIAGPQAPGDGEGGVPGPATIDAAVEALPQAEPEARGRRPARAGRSKRQPDRLRRRASREEAPAPGVAHPRAPTPEEAVAPASQATPAPAGPDAPAGTVAPGPTPFTFVPPWQRGVITPNPAGAGVAPASSAGSGEQVVELAAATVAPWMRGKGQGSSSSASHADVEDADAFGSAITQDVFGTAAPVEPIAGESETAKAIDPLPVWPLADRRGQTAPARPARTENDDLVHGGVAARTDSPVPGRVDVLPAPTAASRVSPAPPTQPESRWKRGVAASIAALLVVSAVIAAAYWYRGSGKTGTLLVQCNVPGIEVLLDGRPAGKTPARIELPAGRHTVEMRGLGKSKRLLVDVTPGAQTTQRVEWPVSVPVGRLRVKSTPPGARVLMGVIIKGITPVTIDDVPVGTHEILLDSDKGSVRTSVNVRVDQTTDVDVPIYRGWLAVFAPVEMRIFEDGRMIGTTLEGRLLMPPGPHTVDITNPRLGYRETRSVEIRPGRVTVVSINSPPGTLVVEAPAGTEILVDGEWKGTMPVEKITVAAGTREVVLRHPQIGQRRFTVTVGVKAPATVSFMAPQ